MTTTTTASIDFTSCGGTLHHLNDGHVPETFMSSNDAAPAASKPPQWVSYPQQQQQQQQQDPTLTTVQVHDDAMPEEVLQALYRHTTHTWGTYVTMNEARGACPSDYHPQQQQQDDVDELQALATKAVAHFLRTIQRDETTKDILDNSNNNHIHGVAVWGLASCETNKVRYHVDYAELIRYEHNVLVPPILAGTLHCTVGTVRGGAFGVNLDGWNHYEIHGYMGKRSGDDMAGYSTPPETPTTTDTYLDPETRWMTIPYRYNRLICHSGMLPHLSTPVISLPPGSKRVIVGFNFFCNDIGPVVQQAPEHSPAFLRRVQKQRSSTTRRNLSLATLATNPTLRKCLILAKREHVKQTLKDDQAKLTHAIQQHLPCTVQHLITTCSCHDETTWPRDVDVHVHVHHLLKSGVLVAMEEDHCSGLIPMTWNVYLQQPN
jgi:hypothetical protein